MLNFSSSSTRLHLALPALLSAAAAALLSAPARAQTCGNGYCDAWAGEDPRTCPADCVKAYPPGVFPPGLYPGAVYPRAAPERHWQAGDPTPPGFHVEERPITGLVIGGGVTLGAAWIISSAIGFSQGGNGGTYAVIPVVGPFIAGAAYRQPVCQSLGCLFTGLDETVYKTFLLTFGFVQAAGVAMLVTGLAVRRDKLVPGHAWTIVPVPLTGQNGTGLGLAGTF